MFLGRSRHPRSEVESIGVIRMNDVAFIVVPFQFVSPEVPQNLLSGGRMISRQYLLYERLGLLLLTMSRVLVFAELHHKLDEGKGQLLFINVPGTQHLQL